MGDGINNPKCIYTNACSMDNRDTMKQESYDIAAITETGGITGMNHSKLFRKDNKEKEMMR